MPHTDPVILAHAFGGRQDLPIPFSYALTGAAAAVVVSFAALGVLWQRSRLQGDRAGRPLPAWLQAWADGPVLRFGLPVLGLALAGFVAVAAIFGPDDALNPAVGLVYVVFWVGIVPASLLFGPVWRQLNPLRTLHRGLARLMRTSPEEGLYPLPAWLGYWPAAGGLLAFTWVELVHPDAASTATLRTWFSAYAGVQILGAAAFGSRWFDRCDAFEVYSSFIGRLAPLGRRDDGQLVLRNPLDGLDGLPAAPGIVAVVCVMLGSTAFDGFSNSPLWIGALQSGQSGSLTALAMGSYALVGTVLVVAVLYVAATGISGLLVRSDRTAERAGDRADDRAGLPRQFAHSIVPIAVGYVVAHYFSLLMFEGQHTLVLASDPLGTEADLFGIGDRGVDYTVVTPAAIALVQVLGVVTGHVVGVVAAHDRAVRLFPRAQAVAGQLPLLVLMVCYTVGGLTLLFAA
ncbi:MAG: hypothetical protein ACRDPK_12465 [Carbonactinosporaceae bacterium]